MFKHDVAQSMRRCKLHAQLHQEINLSALLFLRLDILGGGGLGIYSRQELISVTMTAMANSISW